jgi:hypothetical protein
VAKETRKLRRAQEQRETGDKDKRDALKRPAVVKPADMPDPLGKEQVRALLLRLGLPLLAIWLLCGFVASIVYSQTVKAILIVVPALLTLAAAGLVYWVFRQAKKARGVANILRKVETQEDRKAALSELESS